jgi:hypothetical protein
MFLLVQVQVFNNSRSMMQMLGSRGVADKLELSLMQQQPQHSKQTPTMMPHCYDDSRDVFVAGAGVEGSLRGSSSRFWGSSHKRLLEGGETDRLAAYSPALRVRKTVYFNNPMEFNCA